MPNGGERTWEPKRTKHVHMLGLEDNRQITMVVSCNATWNLLPLCRLSLLALHLKHVPQTTKEREMHQKWLRLHL